MKITRILQRVNVAPHGELNDYCVLLLAPFSYKSPFGVVGAPVVYAVHGGFRSTGGYLITEWVPCTKSDSGNWKFFCPRARRCLIFFSINEIFALDGF